MLQQVSKESWRELKVRATNVIVDMFPSSCCFAQVPSRINSRSSLNFKSAFIIIFHCDGFYRDVKVQPLVLHSSGLFRLRNVVDGIPNVSSRVVSFLPWPETTWNQPAGHIWDAHSAQTEGAAWMSGRDMFWSNKTPDAMIQPIFTLIPINVCIKEKAILR